MEGVAGKGRITPKSAVRKPTAQLKGRHSGLGAEGLGSPCHATAESSRLAPSRSRGDTGRASQCDLGDSPKHLLPQAPSPVKCSRGQETDGNPVRPPRTLSPLWVAREHVSGGCEANRKSQPSHSTCLEAPSPLLWSVISENRWNWRREGHNEFRFLVV